MGYLEADAIDAALMRLLGTNDFSLIKEMFASKDYSLQQAFNMAHEGCLGYQIFVYSYIYGQCDTISDNEKHYKIKIDMYDSYNPDLMIYNSSGDTTNSFEITSVVNQIYDMVDTRSNFKEYVDKLSLGKKYIMIIQMNAWTHNSVKYVYFTDIEVNYTNSPNLNECRESFMKLTGMDMFDEQVNSIIDKDSELKYAFDLVINGCAKCEFYAYKILNIKATHDYDNDKSGKTPTGNSYKIDSIELYNIAHDGSLKLLCKTVDDNKNIRSYRPFKYIDSAKVDYTLSFEDITSLKIGKIYVVILLHSRNAYTGENTSKVYFTFIPVADKYQVLKGDNEISDILKKNKDEEVNNMGNKEMQCNMYYADHVDGTLMKLLGTNDFSLIEDKFNSRDGGLKKAFNMAHAGYLNYQIYVYSPITINKSDNSIEDISIFDTNCPAKIIYYNIDDMLASHHIRKIAKQICSMCNSDKSNIAYYIDKLHVGYKYIMMVKMEDEQDDIVSAVYFTDIEVVQYPDNTAPNLSKCLSSFQNLTGIEAFDKSLDAILEKNHDLRYYFDLARNGCAKCEFYAYHISNVKSIYKSSNENAPEDIAATQFKITDMEIYRLSEESNLQFLYKTGYDKDNNYLYKYIDDAKSEYELSCDDIKSWNPDKMYVVMTMDTRNVYTGEVISKVFFTFIPVIVGNEDMKNYKEINTNEVKEETALDKSEVKVEESRYSCKKMTQQFIASYVKAAIDEISKHGLKDLKICDDKFNEWVSNIYDKYDKLIMHDTIIELIKICGPDFESKFLEAGCKELFDRITWDNTGKYSIFVFYVTAKCQCADGEFCDMYYDQDVEVGNNYIVTEAIFYRTDNEGGTYDLNKYNKDSINEKIIKSEKLHTIVLYDGEDGIDLNKFEKGKRYLGIEIDRFLSRYFDKPQGEYYNEKGKFPTAIHLKNHKDGDEHLIQLFPTCIEVMGGDKE